MSTTTAIPPGDVLQPTDIRPVAAPERIQAIDLLRGWALLGILTVNMEFFAWPLSYMIFPQNWSNPWDAAVETAVKIFAQGKFYTLFSTLFGLGFSFFLLKGERSGTSSLGTYIRRILVLLVIGAIHGYLIWMGDILLLYAVMAFPLLLFRKAKPKTLLVWAAVLVMVPVTMMLAGAIAKASDPKAAADIQKSIDENNARFKRMEASGLATYPTGTFAEVTRQRALEFNSMWSFMAFFGPGVLAMFLMGLYIGRKGYLHHAAQHLPLFRKVLVIGALIGIPASIYAVWASHNTNMMGPSFMGAGMAFAGAFGNPALSYAYAAALLILYHRAGWAARLHPVVCAGRMALTNYLMQSLICTFIFYSHGLGMYGKIGPAYLPLIVLAIYSIELAWSPWWLKRFHFGPAEWLWRTLTYGKAQPMRIRAAAAA
jgi:uncharacterized protein